MSSNDDLIFFRSPLTSLNVRIEMVMPSLSALLAYSSRQLAWNDTPVFGSVLLNQSNYLCIFIFSPRSLHEFWIEYFLPSVQTLNICSVWEVWCYLFPVLCLKSEGNLLQILEPAIEAFRPLLSSNTISSSVWSSSGASRPTSCSSEQNQATFTHSLLSPPHSIWVFP